MSGSTRPRKLKQEGRGFKADLHYTAKPWLKKLVIETLQNLAVSLRNQKVYTHWEL